jgi:hypothetical protein
VPIGLSALATGHLEHPRPGDADPEAGEPVTVKYVLFDVLTHGY